MDLKGWYFKRCSWLIQFKEKLILQSLMGIKTILTIVWGNSLVGQFTGSNELGGGESPLLLSQFTWKKADNGSSKTSILPLGFPFPVTVVYLEFRRESISNVSTALITNKYRPTLTKMMLDAMYIFTGTLQKYAPSKYCLNTFTSKHYTVINLEMYFLSHTYFQLFSCHNC